jgi:hypothetical protein
MSLLNNSRINVDKYLIQFHVMKMNELCPCFKLHQSIIVNPIKNYPILNKYEEPEEPQQEEPEPKQEEQAPVRPDPVPVGPQNSHPPMNIVNHEAQNVEVVPHNDNQVNAQANQPPYEEVNLENGPQQPQNQGLKNETPQNEPKQDHSQNAMYSSNNPNTDTKFGTNNRNNASGKDEDEGGLSFLDEEGDSLFSSGFDDSFELENKPVQNAQPSKFRFR